MARDYAKSKRKSTQRKSASSGGNGLRTYTAGVLTGVFLSFLAYLATLTPDETPRTPQVDATETEEQPRKLRFDFYKELPQRTEQDIPAVIEPAQDVARPAAPVETFVLQAGSFRLRKDADRRRAELLLLGLEPSVEESSGDNGRWFRVYLGPFATRAEMNRVRGLTASQDIDTLQLKRYQQ